MERNLSGKNVLIVQGSLIAGSELKDAFERAGARVYLTGNLISAFNLLQRVEFDGAMIDQGLHNEAFDLCMELRELSIPYMCCASPHRLQGLAARVSDADHAVWKLANVLSIADDSFGDYVPTKDGVQNRRTSCRVRQFPAAAKAPTISPVHSPEGRGRDRAHF
jgi:hypothetical protein